MRLKWNIYAGGCFAASDRNNYDSIVSFGRYSISAISSKFNCEKHLGYQTYFLNEKGRLPGGLWQPLSSGLTNLIKARNLCEQHRKKFEQDQ